MASGPTCRAKRPNTWLHRPMLHTFKKVLANSEPSTHGGKADMTVLSAFAVAIRDKADIACCVAYVRFGPKADIAAIRPIRSVPQTAYDVSDERRGGV